MSLTWQYIMIKINAQPDLKPIEILGANMRLTAGYTGTHVCNIKSTNSDH